MLTVITGGARSGKSTLGLRLAHSARHPVTFIATCPRIEGDDELSQRIAVHRDERPAHWTTIEAEVDLAVAIESVDEDATIIVDWLTLGVSNLVYRDFDEASIRDGCRATLEVVAARSGLTVAVTNEVGLGIVPADAATRLYRDALGRVNQEWVGAADRALFMVAGKALALHDPEELLG